jgi:hypothetical protein
MLFLLRCDVTKFWPMTRNVCKDDTAFVFSCEDDVFTRNVVFLLSDYFYPGAFFIKHLTVEAFDPCNYYL